MICGFGPTSSAASRLARSSSSGTDFSASPLGQARHARRQARAARRLAEDPALEVDGGEHVAVRDHHLRLAEHQRPVIAQREVEVAQDPALGLRVEVHQRVAAEEQVDPRDRRVLHQVVAAEDDRPPQVLAEREPGVGALEVPLAQRLGHGLEPLGGVDGLACHRERAVVDVGRVDLHAFAVGVGAERLGEHDRGRVGLLAGRAARAPDPDRRVLGRLQQAPAGCPRAGGPRPAGRGRSR